jgi:acetylornithine deacetylase/succinyl-diaminopimelate desuccinylase-like protein
MQNALAYARAHHADYLTQFQELLRIPSISTLETHAGDIARAANWLATELTRIGLNNVEIYPTDDHPMVYGEWIRTPDAPTLLVYGHYDCQPIDPVDAWTYPPFGAEIHEGRVYARGASDNKGQHFAHLKAIESILAAEGSLPINIKVLLEGEEEISSPNIETFITANKKMLLADSGVISDGAMLDDGQPSILYGLRGVAGVEVRVNGPARDLHSGSYGGTVLNPIQALTQILAQLHNADGSVAIPGFYDNVLPLTNTERDLLARAPYDENTWRNNTGAKMPWGEPDFTLLERIGARPTLEINGIWGGFQGEGVKTVIPADAGAKITMRLVPHQDPRRLMDLLRDHLLRLAPPEVTVQVTLQSHCYPALMPIDSPEIRAAAGALEAVWGVEPVFTRGGGSLPVVAAFERLLDVPFVLLPLGLDDNRHSPDEHYRLDYFYKGIETAIRYYYALGAG